MFILMDEELVALREGSFEFHCLTMQLKQMTDNGLVFSGPGSVRQLADGTLHFTLYDQKATSKDSMEARKISSNIPPGEIIPEHAFYQLSLTDKLKRNWITSPFTGDTFDITSQPGGSVLQGTIPEMSCSFDVPSQPGNASLKLELFQDLSMPPMYPEGLRCDEQDFNVSIHEKEGSWEIQLAVPGNTFPERIETMVLDALGFVLARPLEWSILMKRSGNTRCISLRSKQVDTATYQIHPPIFASSYDNGESFCQIFLHCLRYIYSYQESYQENKVHPLFAQARAVCRASAGFADTKSLVLCVAVESILDVVVKDAPGLSHEDKQWRDKVREYIDAWEGPERLSQRIKGFLDNLSRTSANDQLETLISIGVVTSEQKKAWNELRHKLAHTGSLGSTPIEEFLALYNLVLVLFYHIVFHEIGYKGRYTDYSAPEWPERDYGIDQGPVTNTDAEVQITEES